MEPVVAAATPPPENFTIRELAGAAEVEAYVALHRAAFGTENMTVGWRRRTLSHPLYRPDLDLVAVANDGTLAAFCIGWFDPVRRVGQIEPLGVHPDRQHMGLGRAILAEALARLRALGAESVLVDAYNVGDAALATYQSAGFTPVYDAPTFARTVAP